MGNMQKQGKRFAVALLLWVGVKWELMGAVGKRAKMENVDKEITNLPNTRFFDLRKEQQMT